MTASDAPLPIPVDPGMPTLAERMEGLRAFYSNAVSDIMDRVLAELILPDDQAAVALDFAQVTAMLMCVKVVELRGQKPTRENLLAVWWPFQKALKDDVPPMLRAFAEVAEAPKPPLSECAQGRCPQDLDGNWCAECIPF